MHPIKRSFNIFTTQSPAKTVLPTALKQKGVTCLVQVTPVLVPERLPAIYLRAYSFGDLYKGLSRGFAYDSPFA